MFYSNVPLCLSFTEQLLQAIIEYLIDERDESWTLWDIIEIAFYDDEAMTEVFSQNQALANSLFLGNSKSPEGKRHHQSVRNTIRSKVRDIEYFAALWKDSESNISIRDFLTSSGVLVIPEDGVTAKDALRKLNSFILQIVGKLAIDGGMLPAKEEPNTWIIVDESTRIAPIPKFDDFLTNGLKRGISVVFGFQSYSIAQKAFGKEDIEGIVEQCTMKALLRLDFKSAQWAEEMCQSYWGNIESITVGTGESKGTSRQNQRGISRNQTYGRSRTKGTQESKTDGTGYQTSVSDSVQRGRSSTQGRTDSTGYTDGTSNSISSNSSERYHAWYPLFGLFGALKGDKLDSSEGVGSTQGSSQSKSRNSGTSSSQSINEGESRSETSGTSSNSSKTSGTSDSEGINYSDGTSENKSETMGENDSVSANLSIQKTPQKLNRIEAAEFSHFPETSPETGLTGVFLMRDLRTKSQAFASKLTIEGDVIKDALIPDEQIGEDINEHRIAPDYDRKLLRRLKNKSSHN